MNFPDLSKMKDMLAGASEMREKMERQLSETIIEASSGGGVVTARINGKKELLALTIDPVVLKSNPDDIEMLQDLIKAAVNEAGRQAEDKLKAAMSGMLGGLKIPGLT